MGIVPLIIFLERFTFAGTTTVRVSVDDVNDNAPYFEPTVPVGQLTENQDPFSQVAIDLAALTEDDDLPPNQNPYRYVPPNQNPYRYVPLNQNLCLPTKTRTGTCLPTKICASQSNPVPPNQNPFTYVTLNI